MTVLRKMISKGLQKQPQDVEGGFTEFKRGLSAVNIYIHYIMGVHNSLTNVLALRQQSSGRGESSVCASAPQPFRTDGC